MRTLSKVTLMSAFAGILSLGLVGPAAAKFPSKPIDFICATSPGSGAAVWCHLVADHLRKDLKNPVKVQFKSGGSNHEPVVYVANKPNDGHTLLHISASFTGYFNLPHFKYSEKDFDILAVMEQHLYAIAVHADSPWKTYKDWIKAAKKAPFKYAMGSNKIGSVHHRHQELIHKTAGIKVRFVPYKGTGDVVKDVIGKHLIIGFAQPGKWNSHIKAGKARALLLLNEKRLDDPLWKDVPVPSDLGINYKIPHQFQGFMVRKGTPKEAMKTLKGSLSKLRGTEAYKKYLSKQPHVIPGYNDNTKELNKEFGAGKKATRKLMIKLGILKAGS
ncbi:MAG: tripartite tricarboxylate transporter substrate binding protein [Rhodospirillaceae bacterium]